MSCRDTWILRYNPKVFWPQHWLPEDVHEDIRVLVLEYSISEKGLEGLVSDIKKSLVFRCALPEPTPESLLGKVRMNMSMSTRAMIIIN